MKRLTILTTTLTLILLTGCKQTAEDRYQRYLEEVNDTTEAGIEFITPGKDSVELEMDDGPDPFANDGGLVTIPEIPQQREVNMNANNYELERVMMGKE